MLGGVELQQIQRLFLGQRRQQGVFLLARGRQHLAVAVELHDLALGLEDALGRAHLDVGDREDRRLHLAGDEAVVDQRVQPNQVLPVLGAGWEHVGDHARDDPPVELIEGRTVTYRWNGEKYAAVG